MTAKHGTLDYRCRRCGKIDSSLHAPDALGTLIDISNLPNDKAVYRPGAMVGKTGMHRCSQGVYGVTDLIGATEDPPCPTATAKDAESVDMPNASMTTPTSSLASTEPLTEEADCSGSPATVPPSAQSSAADLRLCLAGFLRRLDHDDASVWIEPDNHGVLIQLIRQGEQLLANQLPEQLALAEASSKLAAMTEERNRWMNAAIEAKTRFRNGLWFDGTTGPWCDKIEAMEADEYRADLAAARSEAIEECAKTL